ncbi:PKD domain-containing protein [Deinococcus sp.]|uniref:PKD domain-containing protein n=1 Tax=Deinococcus sp. TaxID=47478 RepID=UPI0025FF59A4|nr:PKD domain-containing protein [Deinococcus sp.]
MRTIQMSALMLSAALSLVACSTNPAPTPTNTAPVANFTITPTSGPAPVSVTTANTSSDADAGETATLTYDWNWGDSTPNSTAAAPTHTFAAAGSYTVTLTAKDVKNATSTKTATITVTTAAPVAPTILSVSPADGSVGNAAGAPIVVTFSKPMDASVTQGAYIFPAVAGTTPLATTGSSFVWSAGNTVLTITPTTATTHASTPLTAAFTPNKYSFSISTVAKSDASAGSLPLASQLNVTFSTAVKHTGVVVPVVAAKTLSVDFATLASYPCAGNLCTGDNTSDHQVAAYVTFDLSALNALPADQQPNSFTAAPLTTPQVSVTPSAFTNLTDSGEALQLYSVKYGDPAAVGFSWAGFLNLPVANKITGNFGPSGGPFSADVKTQLQGDWTSRAAQNNLSQYQVRFAKPVFANATDDQLKISNTPSLTVDYLANK